MQPAVYLSHDEISQWIESIKHEILEHPFVAVVGILRGGGFPALCVSFSTGLPVFHIQYDRKTQRASWVGEPPPPGLLLVCEDFAGSGQTLLNSLLFIKETHECKTLTLISDELSRHQADWTRRYNGHRVILPWERHCHSPSHRQDWHSNQGRSGEIEMLEDEARGSPYVLMI